MTDLDLANYYQLGYVWKTHGLKGEAVFVLDVNEPTIYEGLKSVFVELNGKLVPYFIEEINIQNNKAIVRLEDVKTLEGAETLVGNALYLPLSGLPKLAENQFYYHDIVGYQVVDGKLGALGEVANVYEMAHQDLLALHYVAPEKMQPVEVLIPITDEIVTGASHTTREVYVNLPEGLLEVYANNSGEETDETDDD